MMSIHEIQRRMRMNFRRKRSEWDEDDDEREDTRSAEEVRDDMGDDEYHRRQVDED